MTSKHKLANTATTGTRGFKGSSGDVCRVSVVKAPVVVKIGAKMRVVTDTAVVVVKDLREVTKLEIDVATSVVLLTGKVSASFVAD